jgi:dUTPase
VTAQPTTIVTAGQSFGLSVAAEDSSGTIDTSYNGEVTVSGVSSPANPAPAAFVNGVASFSRLTLNRAGSWTLFLQDTSGVLTPTTTTSIAVTAAAATRLVMVSPPPPSVTAGSAFGVIYAAEDTYGNVDPTFKGDGVTVALLDNTGQATLGGTTNVGFSDGLASFTGLTVTRAGVGYTLLASSSGLASSPPGASPTLDVTAAAASQLVVTGQPPPTITAGQAFGLTVTVEDHYGNPATSFSGNLAVAPTDSQAEGSLGGILTVQVPPNSGVANFSGLALDKAGVAFTLQVSSVGFTTVTTSPFSVLAGQADHLVMMSPPPSSVGAGSAFGLTVGVVDPYGNPVADSTDTVDLVLSGGPGTGTLGGATAQTLNNGVATFTGLTIVPPGTGYTLQATSPTSKNLGPATAVLDVTHGAATKLVVTSAVSATVTAGNPFGLAIAAEDPYGNVDTSYSGSITVGLTNPGGATLGGTTIATMSKGVVTFSGLTMTQASLGYILQVVSGGLAPPPSAPLTFDVTAAAPSRLAVTTQPPVTIAAGATFGLTVAVEDQYGNVATGSTGTIAVAATSIQSEGNLFGPVTATVSGGVATFAGLSLDVAGIGLTLQVSDSGLPAVTTSPFTVTAIGATQLVLTSPPPTTLTAGSPFGLQLAAEDKYGNLDPSFTQPVTLTLASNPGGGTLGGTTTVAFGNGLANFSGLTIDKASNTPHALQAASQGLAPSASLGSLTITVTSAVATRLVVISPAPSLVTAGTPFSMTFAAEDPLGNIDPTYRGSVTVVLGNNPGGSQLAGFTNVTFSNGLAGLTGLTVTGAGAGYTLVAASSGLAPPPPSSMSFDVTASPASQLVVTAEPPATIPAGSAFGLSVAAEDKYGNVATGFGGSLIVAPTDRQAEGNLGGVLTVPVTGGVGTFTGLGLYTSGTTFTLQVSATGLSPVTTSVFSVTADPATRLVVVSSPQATVTAGVGFGLQLAAEDAYGNVDSSFAGTATVGLAPGSAQDTLVGTLGARFSGGVATFGGLTLTKAGPGYQLQATAGGLTPAAPSALAFSVTAGAAAQMVLTTPPAAVTAGVGFGLVLAAEDLYGNLAPGYAGGVTLALANNPGGSTLSGSTSLKFSDGFAAFSGLVLDQVGQGYTLQAASQGLTPLVSPPFDVTAIATRLVVISPVPTSIAVGTTFGLTLAAEDPLGNIDAAYKGGVTVALGNNPGGGTLSGFTNASFSDGLAAFSSLSVNSPGVGYTLVASSDGLAPPAAGTSLTFDVTSTSTAIATRLVVISPVPSTVVAGTPFGLGFAAEDPHGNVDPDFKGSVTVALGSNPGGGTLSGFTTASFNNGLATFTGLTVSSPGSGYTLVVASSGLAPLTSSQDLTFNVVSGTASSGGGSTGTTGTDGASSGTAASGGTSTVAASYLVIDAVPATVAIGHYFDLSVEAKEAGGATDTTFSGMVTLALANNPLGASLGGNLTMPMIHGLLTYYDLTLNAPGSGYTIRASSSGLASATSGPITAIEPPAQLAVTAPPPSSIAPNQSFGLAVAVEDASGILAPGYNGSVTLTLASKAGRRKLHGALTVNAVDGVATFSGLTLPKAHKGQTFQIQVTAGGLAPTTTSPITVLPAPARAPHPFRGRSARLRA